MYLLPLPDGEYTLNVKGQFYTPKLTGATDINWWSEVYPEVLIQAALYKMEEMYRNTQGANDHLRAIQRVIQGIDFNMAEDAQGTVHYMRNAW